MAQLSVLAEMVRKAAKAKHAPTPKGVPRGAMGSYGSRPYKSRNPEAGLHKEMEFMEDPVFQSFVENLVPQNRFSQFRIR